MKLSKSFLNNSDIFEFAKYICSVFLLILFITPDSFAEKWGRVTFTVGSVKIIRKGREKNAKLNAGVNVKDRLSTGGESSMDITKANDDVVLKIPENSDIEIENRTGGENTYVKIQDGGIFGNIKKIVSGGEVQFTTPTATATIRGTVFFIKYSRSIKQTELSVFRGVIAFKVGNTIVNVAAGSRVVAAGKRIIKTGITQKEFNRARQAGGKLMNGVDVPENDGVGEEIIEVDGGKEKGKDVKKSETAAKKIVKTAGDFADAEELKHDVLNIISSDAGDNGINDPSKNKDVSPADIIVPPIISQPPEAIPNPVSHQRKIRLRMYME